MTRVIIFKRKSINNEVRFDLLEIPRAAVRANISLKALKGAIEAGTIEPLNMKLTSDKKLINKSKNDLQPTIDCILSEYNLDMLVDNICKVKCLNRRNSDDVITIKEHMRATIWLLALMFNQIDNMLKMNRDHLLGLGYTILNNTGEFEKYDYKMYG